MALADAGAAVVGQRPGVTRYPVLDGARSLEGSLTFFGLAAGVVAAGLALAGAPGWPSASPHGRGVYRDHAIPEMS